MSRKLIDQALEKAKEIGIRNILALRGDPPRHEEYGDPNEPVQNGHVDASVEFTWAVDLVRYIKEHYGDYFCIGVAAYPDGHADQSHPEHQDPLFDLPHLIEKIKAGADFIMTQLFFDIEAYKTFEDRLRSHPSGTFKSIPIIPGLMPIQSYQILRRVTKLSHAKVPPNVLERLDAVKGDDEYVKKVGIDILSEIIETLKHTDATGKRGFHFYTLNLEKAVSQIVERCHLIRDLGSTEESSVLEISNDPLSPDGQSLARRRISSSANSNPRNRVVVEKPSSSRNLEYEAPEKEAGVPSDKPSSRATTLAISEGEGSLGREATWDDFPNGRWGDARSPGAYLALLKFYDRLANSCSIWRD
jgi:methylenetetrahydrofolate reductase (NADPH)